MDGGNSAVDEVARRLGVSSRSLQRHLADERTSYNDLAFFKAFKRWTGMTPREFQQSAA